MGLVARAVFAIALFGFGCGDESESAPLPEPPDDCLAPNRRVGDRCIEPGVQDDGCPAGARAKSDGSCTPAGTPADLCAEGFVHDGDAGCEPVLPAAPCATGLMAVPGEAACRPVMPCGAGTWGDIPVDGTTLYVDASSPSALELGTAADPYHTIGAAYAAAAPNALIAVAEGSYFEDVVIYMKPVRLWGVCPEKVTIVGTGTLPVAVRILPQASGAEVHGVAITSPTGGMSVVASENVLVDRVHIHETGTFGLTMNTLGSEPVSAEVTGVLIERSAGLGMPFSGGQVTVLQSVVRDTQPRGNFSGRGIMAFPCSATDCGSVRRADLSARGVVVERTHDAGVMVMGSEALLEGIVVRDTLPASNQEFGRGVNIQLYCVTGTCDGGQPADVTLVGSLVDRSHDVGVSVIGSKALIEATRVRATQPIAVDMTRGRGINAQACGAPDCAVSVDANVQVVASLVEQNHEIGIGGFGASIAVDATVVRDTQPSAADGLGGRGVNFQDCQQLDGCNPPVRGSAQMHGSIVERNHEIGLMVSATDAILEGVVVRDQLTGGLYPRGGRGLSVQVSCAMNICDPNARARATVLGSHIENNLDFGAVVMSSDATFDGTLVRSTKATPDGLFGDGVAVAALAGPADAALTNTRIAESARAGVAVFGASASLSRVAIECGLFGMNAEPHNGFEAALHDLGDNACGCPNASAPCKAESAGLEAPAPF